MLEWLTANIATIVICACLLAVIVLIIRKMIKDKKQGKSSCGCSCGSCPMSGSCHSTDKKNNS